MGELHDQLKLFGTERVLELAVKEGAPRTEIRAIRAAADLLLPPSSEDLNFLHSGLCQTALPHSRPADNARPWMRRSGALRLIVTPGVATDEQSGEAEYLGVPFGAKARLIMIYLQTEGVRSRFVPLGRSMSSWIRSLGLPVTGGRRGTIPVIKEQVLRIANCGLKLEWESERDGGRVQGMRKTEIVRGLSMWAEQPGQETWPEEVELSEEFHEHLKAHAVPLDRRAIAHLAGTSLGLDLYTMCAYRLPRLERPLFLTWRELMTQLGSEIAATDNFAKKVRNALPHVAAVYPGARIEPQSKGLMLKPSAPAVEGRRSVVVKALPRD
ncbi:RepA protein [Tistlia consotensis]|uniref:RepA protein n=1 Tax=Tistlia consotensis USBA 355 TaxID=560819 RepID=A0A1Y6CSL7_9PROT|nr:replication protein RepA [Tistlia consotensis]SMF85388.1 RepA protein [Tistlia consotensis USBA 355]SNS39141.1 RepA protein [Tistlia consotensis]